MTVPIASLDVHLGDAPLPYYGEYAPFIWGEGVNYDSDGNAHDENEPTHWTELDIRHRYTDERLLIRPKRNADDLPPLYRDAEGWLHFAPQKPREEVSVLSIEGDNASSVGLAAYLTALRSHGSIIDLQTNREIPLDEICATVVDIETRIAAAEKSRAVYREVRGM